MKLNMTPLDLFRTAVFLLISTGAMVVKGNIPLTDEFVETDMRNNQGFEIAFASRPMWHFGMALRNKPCYPAPAFDAEGNQHGVEPGPWPNTGAGCPDPGPPGKGNPFPTYYTITRCNATSIRVVYNLYFPKDGFSNVIIAKGHVHDWERAITIWQKSPKDNLWYRSMLLASFHGGYNRLEWSAVQNTIDYSNPYEQGGRNKEGAKIYVGWAKHAMFTTRNTGWNDPASQGCEREYRSRDWWFIPEGKETLIYAGEDSELGKKLVSVDWGKATSNPVNLQRRVCGEGDGGFATCGFEAVPVEEQPEEEDRDL